MHVCQLPIILLGNRIQIVVKFEKCNVGCVRSLVRRSKSSAFIVRVQHSLYIDPVLQPMWSVLVPPP